MPWTCAEKRRCHERGVVGGRGSELALLDVGDVVVAASAARRPRRQQSPGEEQGRAAATGTAESWGRACRRGLRESCTMLGGRGLEIRLLHHLLREQPLDLAVGRPVLWI